MTLDGLDTLLTGVAEMLDGRAEINTRTARSWRRLTRRHRASATTYHSERAAHCDDRAWHYREAAQLAHQLADRIVLLQRLEDLGQNQGRAAGGTHPPTPVLGGVGPRDPTPPIPEGVMG